MKGSINLPYAFLQKEVKVEEGKPPRKLAMSEALVYAFFYSNIEKGRRTVSVSRPEIVKCLNISPTTVSKSIRTLLLSGLIFRQNGNEFYLSQKVFNETFGNLHS